MVESVEKAASDSGKAGDSALLPGLSPEAQTALTKTIGTMFGMQIMSDMRQEDREMFPEEGTE